MRLPQGKPVFPTWIAAIGFAAALVVSGAQAQEAVLKDLRIRQAVASPSIPGAQAGGAVATVENKGAVADKLLGASTPAAERVEIHVMKMENNIMRMREVGPVEIKAGQTVVMGKSHPEGLHLMLMGLKQPLKEGEKFPITLNFEKAGSVQLEMMVSSQARGAKTGEHKHH
jgi:periplasmic copper chaperone A